MHWFQFERIALVFVASISVATTLNNGVLHWTNPVHEVDVMPTFSSTVEDALVAHTDGSKNVCMNGHFVPELLVMGAVKAGTTTLCSEIRRSPAILWSAESLQYVGDETHPAAWKEGHHFDRTSKKRIDMTNNFPACNMSVRRVAIDGTARYSTDPYVPQQIADWYGKLKNQLKFVMLLREPLNRLHSHYHQSILQSWCSDFNDLTFEKVVRRILTDTPQSWLRSSASPLGHGCGDFIEGSLYSNHFKNYFEVFDTAQFTVVPFLYNVAAGFDGRPNVTVAASLWKRLGIKGLKTQQAHANPRSHVAMEDELSPGLITRMRKWFDTRTGPQVLASLLSTTNAYLYGYQGSYDDTKGIANWLQNNW